MLNFQNIRITNFVRYASSNYPKNEFKSVFVNRNPRNLEKLRIAYKPDGYHLDNPGKCYWNRLNLYVSGKYVTASINHFQNGEVITASTSEWCVSKFLYKTKDTSAFINLGKVLGQRCLKAGIIEISCFIKPTKDDGKVSLFLKAIKDSGISLEEPPQFKSIYPWDCYRPEKPWEVVE